MARAGRLDAELLEARGRPVRAGPSSSARRVWIPLLLGVPALSLAAALARGEVFNAAGWNQMMEFWRASVSPDLSPTFLTLTLDATLTTLAYALLGSTLSVAIGLAAGVVAARSSWTTVRRPLRWAIVGGSRAVLSAPRGVHEAIWGLLLIAVLGADPLVAILAIGIPYGAITAKVVAEILDEAPQDPYRAIRAAGAPRSTGLMYGLLPVAAGDIISYVFYRFECSIRAAAILGLIGAGGLGYELALSFRTLRYAEMWTLIYALVALSGLADLWSSRLRRSISDRTQASGRRPVLISGIGWVVLCIVSAFHVGASIGSLFSERALRGLELVASGLWPPALPAETFAALVRASLQTLEMSVIATAIAGCLGALTSALMMAGDHSPTAGRVWGAGARTIAKALLLLCRAIPPPVWALLLLFVMLPGMLPGALALGIYNFGILGRLMYEAAENLDPAPRRALLAAGVSGPQSFLYASAPRLAPRYVALCLYRWEVTTRETVIVGLVGAGGLGRLLTESLAAFDFARVSGVLVALIAITLAVDAVSAAARSALR